MYPSVHDLNYLETIDVLKETLAAWRQLLNFRLTCTQLDGAENFLSALVLVSPKEATEHDFNKDLQDEKTKNFILSLSDIQKNDTRLIDIRVLKSIWNTKTLNATCLQQVVSFFDEKLILPQEFLAFFDKSLAEVKKNQPDIIIQTFYIYHILSVFFNKYKIDKTTQARIQRIVNIKMHHDEGILEHPVLFHLHFLEKLSSDFSVENLRNFIKGCAMIYYLGFLVLTHVIKLYNNLKLQVANLEKLKNIDKSPEVFSLVFSKVVLKISDMMEVLHWKRDKVARFLNSLVSIDYFTVQKFGRDKIYLNLTLLKTLQEISRDQVIINILS